MTYRKKSLKSKQVKNLKSGKSLKSRILTTSTPAVIGAALAVSAAAPTTAFAQDPAAAEDTVVVTGSRIVRRDFESNSPIVTIEAAQFEQQAGLNVEAYLNQLPEYNPAASPVTTQGDVQITPVNSVGIASISLRGFGPNRSLVLIDGKRPVPVNTLMVQDINGIPSALIQRVETITGGASATYGADAVGGVTNFILRKDYEGLEFDGQYGISEAGDGEETRVSLLFGANLADGRGNVTIGLERYEREESLAIERDHYTDRWADPAAPGFFFFYQGVNGYSCNTALGANCPRHNAMNALFGGQSPLPWFAAFSGPYVPTYAGINFNPDGTVFVSGFPFYTARGVSRFGYPVDGLRYAPYTQLDASDPAGAATFTGVKWNNLQEYAGAPQDRYSIFGSANYDVTDRISVFGNARFAQSRTRTLLFGTNAISGWESDVPYNPTTDSPINPALNYTDPAVIAAATANPAAFFAANPNPNFRPTGTAGAGHPVPAELAWLLNSRPNPAGRWQPQWNPDTSLPPRNTYNTITTWQMDIGANIELPFRDWTAELYFSHGESLTYNEAGGNMSLTRYRSLINYPDYGRGASGTGNIFYTVGTGLGNAQVVPAVRPRFGVGDFSCTSGLYDTLFRGDMPMSEDCFNALNAVLQTRTEIVQEIFEVNLQGGVIDLPAGEARMALGYQHRQTDGKFNPDILQSQDSFQDQVIGVYPTGYLNADTTVNDFYVEALVPVVSDLPFARKIEIEAGARYSDYSEIDQTEWTWKALANFEVTDWARLRGGFNKATRAPNLGELFLNPQEIFTGGGNFGDPCSVRANAPWGAGGTTLATDPVQSNPNETPPALAAGQTQAGADRTQQICEALMGTAGANFFYRSGLDVVQQGAGGGFAWVLQEGNPNLQPEKAKTWTAGFVLRSPLENAWLSGLQLSFDWYRVKINNAIMTYSIDFANFRCFGADTGLAPAAQAATAACQLVPRDTVNGAALNTTLSYDNAATIKTSGFDVALNWFGEFAALGADIPGGLSLSIQGTILDTYETRQSPAPYDVPIEWKGSLGPNLPGTQGGSYKYRIFSSLGYVNDDWSVTLRWRHLPGIWAAGHAEEEARIKNNAAVSGGADGILLTYTPGTFVKVGSYNVFDLAANWTINEMFTVRAGVTNLFNKEPPYVGSTAGRPPGSTLNTVCGSAPACTNPTAFSLPQLGAFNGGYYDTLGRRFFVGLKANF